MDQNVDFAKSIFEHNQDLINFVDAKAGIILAGDGAILALLSSSFVTEGAIEQIMFGFAVVLVGLSAIFAFATIRPRMVSGTPSTKIFFGSILKKTREQYLNDFSARPEDILEDYLNNIYTLAVIEKFKFRYLKASLYCLLISLFPIIMLLTLLHI